MKIKIQHTTTSFPKTLLIPIIQEESMEPVFSTLEKQIGSLSNLLKEDFKAEKGSIHIIYGDKTKYFLIGLGQNPSFAAVLTSFRTCGHQYKKQFSKQIGINFLHQKNDQLFSHIDAAINGLALAQYNIGLFKSAKTEQVPLSEEDATIFIYVKAKEKTPVEQSAFKGLVVAETQLSILDLINAPSNKKLPSDLANWARRSGKKYGYKVNIFDKTKITKTGLEALLAVNRGSEYPPTFIIMEYRPKPTKANKLPKIGLVGKGVTFDTGGLSLKPSNNMHYMKSDMGGAAAVFGAMELTARLQLPIHLIGIVPATDNSIGSKAIKPSDVIGSYSGKTIEIIDTDAEGRLILADGLAYMVKNYKPETLIDLATLTGSSVRTFGYHAGALFSNNDDLAEALYTAGDKSGERVWRLPIWKEYEADIKSDVADVRNYGGKPIAGAIAAAKFLEVFTAKHPRWAHLDIAGVAFGDSEFSKQKSGTGFGVRLLVEFFEALLN